MFKIEPDKLPNLPAMMLATIQVLKDLGGSAHLSELDDEIIEQVGLSEEEQSYMMPNDKRPRVNYFLSWSRTFLKKAGALQNSSRGVWALNEKGERINSLEECQKLYEQVQREERERAKSKKDKDKPGNTEADNLTTSPTGDTTPSQSWDSELLEVLGEITPEAFERLSQRILREAGFIKVEVRGKTGDGGIDGVGVLRVNLVSFQVYFQCKRWKGSVGSREIRDFRGALQGRADKGLFITTGTFTSQASEEATRDGAIAIDLIDGNRLCELLKQFKLGVQTEMVEQVSVNKNWFVEF